MKKFLLLSAISLSLLSFTGCGKSDMISENNQVEFNIEQSGWDAVTDTDGSYIVSKDSDMISYSKEEIKSPDDIRLPITEEELLEYLGEDTSDVSQISNFSFLPANNGKSRTLSYTQTITLENGDLCTIITKDSIVDTTRVTITATLMNASQKEIDQVRSQVEIN